MSRRKQLLIGAVANLGNIATGLTIGFSAVALPAMQTAHHEPPVSDEQTSWIASLISVSMPVGCILEGPLLDRLGRRVTLIMVNIPSVLGWLIIASASHRHNWFLFQVYVGRLLTGLSSGCTGSPSAVYVSEVLDKKLRGLVITWGSLVYILRYVFQQNWRLIAGICTFLSSISIVSAWYLLPETPVWLASRGRIRDADVSMRLIRRVPQKQSLPESLQVELDTITTQSALQHSSNWRDKLTFLKRPEAYKPILIMNAFMFFQQFSGIYVIILYGVTIVQEIGITFDGYIVTVIIGIIRLVMSLVISYASKRFGRRFLCNVSGVGMTLSMGILTGLLGLSQGVSHTWLLITPLIIFIVFCTIGFLPLPYAMIGEVFPLKIRGPACSETMFMGAVLWFIVVKLFPSMKNWMGYHNVFAMYTGMIAMGTVVMYLYLPETQGKSLYEIEEAFRGNGKCIRDAELRDKRPRGQDTNI
ncbi:facilitated trehalose transporter Tret1-like isoform X2 [Periplaneta americana]|uniref:facilitated trehalose transporter Tret1-like isoform X2 n=1 Tax=Periplaneta americana TaxID=6978 RepID=UPI0037E94BC7